MVDLKTIRHAGAYLGDDWTYTIMVNGESRELPEGTTVAGDTTYGGSLGGGAGPITVDDMLFVSSGYGLYFHMPGNALLAFGKSSNHTQSKGTQ